jgi:hypothetical protein
VLFSDENRLVAIGASALAGGKERPASSAAPAIVAPRQFLTFAMRFVPVNFVGQQAALSQHRVEQSRAFVGTGSKAGFRQ